MSNNWITAALEAIKKKRLNCSILCHNGTFHRTETFRRSYKVHISHPRSAGDAAATSSSTHRKDDGARRDTELAPAWLELAVDTFQRRKSAPCFGVKGCRGKTRTSQPSCDTNSAATRCSCGGGARRCERPATRLAQVGRGAFTTVRRTRPKNGGAITAILAGKRPVGYEDFFWVPQML